MRFTPGTTMTGTVAAAAGVVISLAIALGAAGVQAAENKIGTFNNWEAYVYQTDKQKVCYLYATPEKSEGDYNKRGQTYVMVTHHPKSKDLNVVNVVAGYTYKLKSEVEVEIDGKSEKLFTDRDSAWAANEELDNELVDMMRSGAKLVIEGRSSRGTLTKDIYSLSGFTAAHKAASKACGVKA